MLRALIVDDESPARNRLKKLLRSSALSGRVECAGEAVDGLEALSLMQSAPVDMLFLDIQMPELDGFGVVERLPLKNRPFIVFTTAYDNYAIKAFEANAIDYLLKPISEERLSDAVSRAERVHERSASPAATDEQLGRLLDWLDSHASTTGKMGHGIAYLKQVSVPHKDRMVVIPVTRIISIEAQDGITRMYTTETRPDLPRSHSRHIVSYTLDQMEAHLDPDDFIRVHRSAIVRLDQVKEIIPWFSGRCKLMMTGGHEVIASRTRSKDLKQRLTP